MTASLKLLACQIEIPAITTAAERDRHLEQVAERIRARLGRQRLDLVVLPELSSIDYARPAFERLDVLAEPLDGPSFQVMSRLARDCAVGVVYGIARRAGDGYRITQVAVGPDGALIGAFDKLHIAQYGASFEKEFFERGERLFLFELKGLKIAPIICYDIRIPELARTLALRHGAQLILHCGAYARDESFHSWHAFVVARAMENQVYVLSLNRAGADFGSSLFCGPWVDEATPAIGFPPAKEAMRLLEVDPTRIETVRQRYSFLADRLADYDALGSGARRLTAVRQG